MWHSKPIKKILATLHTTIKGLSVSEARKRLASTGENKMAMSHEKSVFVLFFRQFTGPMNVMLMVALIIAFLIHENADAIIIGVTIIGTALFGFWQEYSSAKALTLLRTFVEPTARVVRDGATVDIPSKELVVGDIIRLVRGMQVPADCRLVSVHHLEINESVLTGEALPRLKQTYVVAINAPVADRVNMCFQGTFVSGGDAIAVVVATGMRTEFAHIAGKLAHIKEPKTPLEKNTERLVLSLAMLACASIVAVVIIGRVRGLSWYIILQTSVAVGVAIIPEGLTVSVTGMLALGARSLLQNRVLVRSLRAVETLGAVSVICTDKTGTLTEGVMQVVDVRTTPDDGNPTHALLEAIGLGCAVEIKNANAPRNKWIIDGSPTEKALFEYALSKDPSLSERKMTKILDSIPFDSKYKLSATLVKMEKHNRLIVIGAPEAMLSCMTPHTSHNHVGAHTSDCSEWAETIASFTKKGMRVIAVAASDVPHTIMQLHGPHSLRNLTLLGIVVLGDPIRKSVPAALAAAQRAGIRVCMITGDNINTAKAIAKSVGIATAHSLEGITLSKLSDKMLRLRVAITNVFARVSPLDKLRLVQAFEKRRAIVAMTGDGINDSAALQQAHIGISVGSGHDIAKESSDLVLLDGNFESIVEAISGGRRIYDNIRKVLLFLLYGSLTEALLIVSALAFGFPLPLLPVQILWVNIIADTFPAMAFIFEPGEPETMNEKPRNPKESLFNRMAWEMLIVGGIINTTALLSLFWWYAVRGHDLALGRSVAFVGLGAFVIGVSLTLKSLRRSLFHTNIFSNIPLLISLIGVMVVYAIAFFVPMITSLLRTVYLPINAWGAVFLLIIINITVVELVKLRHRYSTSRQKVGNEIR